MGVNIAQVVRQHALRHPDRVALVAETPSGERIEVHYAALDALARRVGRSILDAGVSPGGAVGITMSNGVDYVATFFGAAYAGCIAMPMPPAYAVREVAHRLSHAHAALLVHDDETVTKAVDAAREGGARAVHAGELSGEGPALEGPADLAPDATALLLYTSGTTGAPKGACISHASLLGHSAALVHHTLDLDDSVVAHGVLPLSHSYGTRMVLLVPFYAGGRAVLMRRFDAARSLEWAAREGVTWLPGVPTMFHAWADLDAPPALDSVRWCLSAGAPLAPEVRRAAEATLGATVRDGYGLTEATFTAIDAPPHAAPIGSVGRPVWGVEVSIRDAEGAVVPTGDDGEIYVRGQNVMLRYRDDDAATARALGSGWLRTGDIGRLDDEGHLFIVDRKNDLILRGGRNIYPAEVEAALLEHPSIARVAVFGTGDPVYGEQVVAAIVAREGAPEVTLRGLAKHCAPRIAGYKRPRILLRVGRTERESAAARAARSLRRRRDHGRRIRGLSRAGLDGRRCRASLAVPTHADGRTIFGIPMDARCC